MTFSFVKDRLNEVVSKNQYSHSKDVLPVGTSSVTSYPIKIELQYWDRLKEALLSIIEMLQFPNDVWQGKITNQYAQLDSCVWTCLRFVLCK